MRQRGRQRKDWRTVRQDRLVVSRVSAANGRWVGEKAKGLEPANSPYPCHSSGEDLP